jgi:hypothetical protein
VDESFGLRITEIVTRDVHVNAADDLAALARVTAPWSSWWRWPCSWRACPPGGTQRRGSACGWSTAPGLSRRRRVAVVEVGGRALVLGVTSHGVSVLTELDPEQLEAPGPGPTPRVRARRRRGVADAPAPGPGPSRRTVRAPVPPPRSCAAAPTSSPSAGRALTGGVAGRTHHRRPARAPPSPAGTGRCWTPAPGARGSTRCATSRCAADDPGTAHPGRRLGRARHGRPAAAGTGRHGRRRRRARRPAAGGHPRAHRAVRASAPDGPITLEVPGEPSQVSRSSCSSPCWGWRRRSC